MLALSSFDRDDLTLPVLTAAVGGALAIALLHAAATKKTALATGGEQTTRRVHTLESRGRILGDLPEFSRNAERLNDWLAETSLRFQGEPWRVHLPGVMDAVVATTPELVEEVMATQFDTFAHGDAVNDAFVDLFGRSLVTTDGEAWYHQRKAATKFFTAKALRQMYDVIDATAANGDAIDMLKLFHEFALQTFAEVGLGLDLKLIGAKTLHPMEHAIEDSTPALMRRLQVPSVLWKLERWLNIGQERKVAAAMGPIHDWIHAIIPESLEAAGKRQAERQAVGGGSDGVAEIKSVVELFLEQSSEDKLGLKPENLEAFILTFILGARGTSAMALVWTFLMLAKHPHVEDRIREEIQSALPDLEEDTYLTSDHVHKLVYLEATIKEVLRLYPTVPLLQRVTFKGTVLGSSIPVKKGETVFVPMYAMARLPSVWGPDAAAFKPDRWINAATGSLVHVPSAQFNTFGTGPRVCIGMKLAMLELHVVMANLLRRYRFSLAAPNDCRHTMSLELMPVTPLMMTAVRHTSV